MKDQRARFNLAALVTQNSLSRTGPTGPTGLRRTGLRRPKIDREREDAIDDRSLGVSEHCEIHEIELRLFHEPSPVGALDRRDPAVANRLSADSETLDHGLRVELVRHPGRLYRPTGRLTERSTGPTRNDFRRSSFLVRNTAGEPGERRKRRYKTSVNGMNRTCER